MFTKQVNRKCTLTDNRANYVYAPWWWDASVLHTSFSALCNLCQKQQAEILMEPKRVFGWMGKKKKNLNKRTAYIIKRMLCLGFLLLPLNPLLSIFLSHSPASLDIKHNHWHMNPVCVCVRQWKTERERNKWYLERPFGELPHTHTHILGHICGVDLHAWCCETNTHACMRAHTCKPAKHIQIR